MDVSPGQHNAAPPTASPDALTGRLVMIRRGHRWIFEYGPGDRGALISRITAMAADQSCPLDWADAAILSRQLAGPTGAVGAPAGSPASHDPLDPTGSADDHDTPDTSAPTA